MPAIKDPKRIDIADPQELRTWATLFRTTEQRVVSAVETVGPMATLVALHLGGQDTASDEPRVDDDPPFAIDAAMARLFPPRRQ